MISNLAFGPCPFELTLDCRSLGAITPAGSAQKRKPPAGRSELIGRGGTGMWPHKSVVALPAGAHGRHSAGGTAGCCRPARRRRQRGSRELPTGGCCSVRPSSRASAQVSAPNGIVVGVVLAGRARPVAVPAAPTTAGEARSTAQTASVRATRFASISERRAENDRFAELCACVAVVAHARGIPAGHEYWQAPAFGPFSSPPNNPNKLPAVPSGARRLPTSRTTRARRCVRFRVRPCGALLRTAMPEPAGWFRRKRSLLHRARTHGGFTLLLRDSSLGTLVGGRRQRTEGGVALKRGEIAPLDVRPCAKAGFATGGHR